MQILAVPVILVLKAVRMVSLRCAHPPNAVALQDHKSVLYNKPTSAPDDGRKGRPKHVQHTCSC